MQQQRELPKAVTLKRLFDFGGSSSPAPTQPQSAPQAATPLPQQQVQPQQANPPAQRPLPQGRKVEPLPAKQTSAPKAKPAAQSGNYVIIEKWNSAPKNGQKYANDCLSRVMANIYPNVKPYSKEWQALAKNIMDKNPSIYNSGRRSVGGSGQINTLLKDGEKLYL